MEVHVNGNDLVLRAPAPPPDRVLNHLVKHKFEVIALNLAAGED